MAREKEPPQAPRCVPPSSCSSGQTMTAPGFGLPAPRCAWLGQVALLVPSGRQAYRFTDHPQPAGPRVRGPRRSEEKLVRAVAMMTLLGPSRGVPCQKFRKARSPFRESRLGVPLPRKAAPLTRDDEVLVRSRDAGPMMCAAGPVTGGYGIRIGSPQADAGRGGDLPSVRATPARAAPARLVSTWPSVMTRSSWSAFVTSTVIVCTVP